jgi:hypothetical protein
MNFKDSQFIYDNMSEPEYSDEQEYEQDYEPDEEDEDLNAECVW